ncbi:FmdB family zinc ribbon protein [Actinocrispum wychmicini]|uniref:Putative FmdB family regulatory protein n=1 Tax=Actinocrispum wychmicini TaxID=1213861 RepID=A0A4R2JF73_9PSEU|nr:FmdB family zinc ribbon protein [Actinocrispum wychmicini]TCO58381.1 putative FmdB family regulatory protein [Actinocrispum wychmicini]
MPTYQYACTVCDHRFEQVQSFSDPSLTVCPECTGKLRKLYSSVGVVFKGSGFYRTDSRSSAKSTASTSTSSESTSSTPTPSTTKSESTSTTSSTTSSTPAAKAS